jgi:hypothetical protein
MKKLLLILICLPLMNLAQQTYVPDDNFEAYLENHGMGNGMPNDNYVTTAHINSVTVIILTGYNIYDLTGIEDFNALTELWCEFNQLTSLDVSNNTALTGLRCDLNQLTSLDVSNNTALVLLTCTDNLLTSLDVSGATSLTTLNCWNNQLTSLDVSQNTAFTTLSCGSNQLTTLDVRTGNSNNMYYVDAYNNHFPGIVVQNNPYLTCINVDDSAYSTANWIVATNMDAQHYFSNNCSGTAIQEHTTNKELLRTIDLLGRETKNNPLFYIYDDGTVEKRIVIE